MSILNQLNVNCKLFMTNHIYKLISITYFFRRVDVPSEPMKISCEKDIFNLDVYPELAQYFESVSLTYPLGEKPEHWETPCAICPCKREANTVLYPVDPVKKIDPNPNTSGCGCTYVNE